MGPDPLRGLLAAAPFGIALLDTSLRYVEVNDYLARAHGIPVSGHVGRSWRDVAPAFAPDLERHSRHVLETGDVVEGVRLRNAAPDGTAREWLVSLHAVRDATGAIVGVGQVLLDVTHSIQTEEQLARRTAQQAVVARFGQRALAGLGVEVLREEAAELAATTLGVEFGEVLELEGDTLVLRAGFGWRDGALGTRIGAGPQTQAGTVVVTRAPVVVENLTEERRFQAVRELREHGIVSGASVPIESQGAFHGVLAAHALKPRRFSTDDLAFLQALANVLGAAMERAQVDERLRESAQRLHLALQAGRLGAWEWDLAEGVVRWSSTLEEIYGLEPGGFTGLMEDYEARLHPDDRERVLAIIAQAVETDGVLPEFEHRIVRPDGSVRWLHCTGGGPVRQADGSLSGMLGLTMDVTERKQAEDERARLLEAEHAARTAAEAARERLAFLARVTEVLGTTLDVEELLSQVTSLSIGAFADGCAVDLLDGGVLRRAFLDHRDPLRAEAYRELRRLYPPRSGAGNALLRVVETRKPLLIGKISEDFQRAYALDERHLALMRIVDARSAICVPLVARDRVLGLLSFVRDEDRPFDEDGLALAEDVARRLALAIDNALLFQERVEGENRFRSLAQTLQASLLPPHLPEIPGVELAAAYRPAAKGVDVGGDFYDVFPLEQQTWGIVVGDVCGKGPEAATLTAFARYTLRAAAVHHAAPSLAIATLNEAVLRDDRHEPGRFLTLVFARMRPADGGAELTLSLGGHPSPLVIRANGLVELAGDPGTLVGVEPRPELRDTVVRLGPGDTLLCFTDGVTDVRRGADFFGDTRLVELAADCAGLAPEKLIRRVEQALDEFGGGISRDDTALLALRVRAS